MTGSFSRQVQDELTHCCHPHPPPTLRALLVLFSADGLETFAIVDGRGGDSIAAQGRPVLTVCEGAPFARAFHGAAVGDLVSFTGVEYMVAGGDEELPSLAACASALALDPALRQATGGMAPRLASLSCLLREQRRRLDEDQDTVQKARRHHVYLFEQGRWIVPEFPELLGLEGKLQALRLERGRRDIGRLAACYALELARPGVLEGAAQDGTRREAAHQSSLRARRPAVLRAEEAARLKKAGNAPRRVQ